MAVAGRRSDAGPGNGPRLADATAWLRLCLVAGLGGSLLRRLLGHFGTPQDVLAAGAPALESIVGRDAAAAIKRGPDLQRLDIALAWLQQPDNRLLTLADGEYPQSLLQTADPPVVLYVCGRVELLQHAALAVVGSRNPTPGGLADAEAFAEALSHAGLTIVSGLALGIDAAAHRGGLRGASSTIAVLGTGLDRVYPARHRELAHDIAQRGLLISEFALGTPAVASNFPRRNRIISGLARGCLVVEAALHSGSLITARQALEQGRDVFAVPGSIHSPLSKGCHWLIKQGAKLVESAQDVLEELDLSPGSNLAPNPETLSRPVSPLTPEEAALLAAAGFAPVDLDMVCARGGLTPDAASAMLLKLELEGYMSRLPGGLFQRLR
jgi:DNA processing protein